MVTLTLKHGQPVCVGVLVKVGVGVEGIVPVGVGVGVAGMSFAQSIQLLYTSTNVAFVVCALTMEKPDSSLFIQISPPE